MAECLKLQNKRALGRYTIKSESLIKNWGCMHVFSWRGILCI
jgi:hypothetical protein